MDVFLSFACPQPLTALHCTFQILLLHCTCTTLTPQVLTTTGGLERLAYYACLISKGHPFYTLVLMSFSCFLISCVLPNIAAVLVVVPTAISICELMEVDPRPFVIVLSIFASFGGTATMIGEPGGRI